jgi:imidazolonepropionase-like amidohydrolase
VNPEKDKISIPSAANHRTVWLHVGTLIDGIGKTPLRNAHIVYDANAILFVGEHLPPQRVLKNGQSSPDVSLPFHTLLPGLIESHAHLFLDGGELRLEQRRLNLKESPENLLTLGQKRLEGLTRLGIIGVRDAGDKHGVGLSLSKLYKSKKKSLLPYIDSPGAAIHHRGEYGGFMSEPIEQDHSLQECVKSRVNSGADRIKLIATDVIDFTEGTVTKKPQMTGGEIFQIVHAAKTFGMQTFAHASGTDGVKNVIEGNVNSIEHGFFVSDAQLARMRDRNIAWVPTFAPVQKQIDHAGIMGWDEKTISNLRNIIERHASSLLKANSMGVVIIAGSDAGSYGVPHGDGLLFELKLMERAGLSPLTVINTATGNSSAHLGFREKFGQLAPGFKSRFILTRHSPLDGVSQLTKEKYVIFDGDVVD